MQAIVQSSYGSPDVLRLEQVEKPSVGDDEVLVRVRAASVNPLDWHDMRGEPYFLRLGTGLRRPKNPIRGVDLAGQVEAVGKNVEELTPGEEVFGVAHGAFAEYAVCAEERLVHKPARLSFEEAAALPVAALTALQALRDHGRIRAGQRVLVVGASGGVGTSAVQIAKSFGAEVTGVCSTRNLDLVRSLGADHVIDYSREDFTRTEKPFDLIVDMAGTHSLSECRRALTRRGTYVVVGGPSGRWLRGLDRFLGALVTSLFVPQRMAVFVTAAKKEDLETLRDLVVAGKLTPVIDRRYPLDEVPEAVGYLEQGHARGKVVIEMG